MNPREFPFLRRLVPRIRFLIPAVECGFWSRECKSHQTDLPGKPGKEKDRLGNDAQGHKFLHRLLQAGHFNKMRKEKHCFLPLITTPPGDRPRASEKPSLGRREELAADPSQAQGGCVPISLQITLIVVLLALAAGMLSVIFYLGRATRSLDVFLQGAQKDLTRISDDAHASRLRMDQLADSLQTSLDEFAGLARAAGNVGRMVGDLQTQFQIGMESVSRNLGSLLGLLGPVLAVFRSPRHSHGEEKE